MSRKQAQPDNPEFKRVLNYSETFSTDSGLITLKDMRRTFFDRVSYVPGDPYATAFAEGQRSVVAQILSNLKQSSHPEMFEPSLDEYED